MTISPYLSSYLPTISLQSSSFSPTTHNLRNQASVTPRYSRLSSSFQSFFPSCSREWNKLPLHIQHAVSFNTFRSLVRTPTTTNKNYNRLCSGNQGRWLARLRMELSALNLHRYKYHFIPSPICPTCQTHSESTSHFFFHCPTHHIARANLNFRLEAELGLDTDNPTQLLETILFGKFINPQNYNRLLDITYQYLQNTGRFN